MNSRFIIYDQHEAEEIAKKALEAVPKSELFTTDGRPFQPRTLLKYIGDAKNYDITPDKFEAWNGEPVGCAAILAPLDRRAGRRP